MTADTVGGVWTYALELAGALAPHGVEVTLATTGPRPTADQRRALADSVVVAAFSAEFRLEWMAGAEADVERAGDWLLRTAKRLRPDLVHLNGYAHAALPWPAPVLVVGHSCVLSWHEAVRGEPAGPEWEGYARAVRAGLAAADLLVAPTRALLAELRRLYRPRCDALVVANGRDPRRFRPGPKEPFVLSVGRLWDEAKNLAALARAAARSPWPVRVAGEGGAAAQGVELLGRVDEARLADLYARASVFALPARYEPFGLAALEAGLAGCALVLGDVPSLREVWGDAALYVPPDDDGALAAALGRLADDPALLAGLAARARRRALSYSPERMAAGYLEAYERLLAASPAWDPTLELSA